MRGDLGSGRPSGGIRAMHFQHQFPRISACDHMARVRFATATTRAAALVASNSYLRATTAQRSDPIHRAHKDAHFAHEPMERSLSLFGAGRRSKKAGWTVATRWRANGVGMLRPRPSASRKRGTEECLGGCPSKAKYPLRRNRSKFAFEPRPAGA